MKIRCQGAPGRVNARDIVQDEARKLVQIVRVHATVVLQVLGPWMLLLLLLRVAGGGTIQRKGRVRQTGEG